MREMAAVVQSGSIYETSATFLLAPFTDGMPNQIFDPIENNSIVGHGFRDIPQQGIQHVFEDPITILLDKISCQPWLQALCGAPAVGVYNIASHVQKLSVAALTSLKCHKYANVYIKKLNLKGSVNNNWTLTIDLISKTAEVREVVGNFPSSPTSPDEPFVFHEAGGTGYFRIGDTVDALSASDEVNIEEFSLDIVPGFDGQWCNEGRLSLIPLFGQVPPSVSGSFTVARHDSDTWSVWEEEHTRLQAELYIYKSATASLKVQIPRFIVQSDLTDDDVTKLNITMQVGRNGLGTAYQNTNMSFNNPVRITLVNS